jgi:hypothetical protein
MADYKFFKNREGATVGVVYKESTWIPNEPTNIDWIEYQEWAETNETDPAD